TLLPELLRHAADISGLPVWFSKFLLDGRLIIFGFLIAIGTVFFPQGLLTPATFRRRTPQPEVTAPLPEGNEVA
ncbi:MAG TPA: hypothetical protein VMT34_07145, partial [Aggregatilineales bacterium]|nr:hypothetical protein [Aggregatilineales bacterium]